MSPWRALSSVLGAAALALLATAVPLGCGAEAARPAAPRYEHAPPEPSGLEPVAPPTDAGAEDAGAAAPPPPARKADRFAVATENATATRVALEVLRSGGAAADAAVAAVLAMGVTHPVSSGLGGGGFALIWDARTKRTTVLDFRETAPIGIRPEEHAGRAPRAKKRGTLVGVPGEIAGLAELHARFGTLAWSELVARAATIAGDGFPVSPHMARALRWNEAWVTKAPRYALWQTPAGALAASGDAVKNPALAATLRRLASEGKAAFYEGAIATDVLATAREAGSRMTPQDLRGYAVIERAPLSTTWEGFTVETMPPPSAGGLMLIETLHMHAKSDLLALGYGTGAYQHLLAETFRGAIADRIRAVGDPAFARIDPASLTDRARMKARRARIALDATTRAESFAGRESGTSHLVIADGAGSVVSITSTVNDMFGARLVTQGGFPLNDELDDFTPPSLGARFGVRRGPNTARGGARPASSMMPTIVLRDGAPVLALGGSGGWKIATAATQVTLARLAFDRSPADAVADIRIDAPPTGGLLIDPGAPAELVADLERRGEIVARSKPFYSAVQALAIEERDGIRALQAGADPRKLGAAAVE